MKSFTKFKKIHLLLGADDFQVVPTIPWTADDDSIVWLEVFSTTEQNYAYVAAQFVLPHITKIKIWHWIVDGLIKITTKSSYH